MPCNTVYDATTYFGVVLCFPILARSARIASAVIRACPSRGFSVDCSHSSQVKREGSTGRQAVDAWLVWRGIAMYFLTGSGSTRYCYLIAYHSGRRTLQSACLTSGLRYLPHHGSRRKVRKWTLPWVVTCGGLSNALHGLRYFIWIGNVTITAPADVLNQLFNSLRHRFLGSPSSTYPRFSIPIRLLDMKDVAELLTGVALNATISSTRWRIYFG